MRFGTSDISRRRWSIIIVNSHQLLYVQSEIRFANLHQNWKKFQFQVLKKTYFKSIKFYFLILIEYHKFLYVKE